MRLILLLILTILSYQAKAQDCPALKDVPMKQNIIQTIVQKYQPVHFARYKTPLRISFSQAKPCHEIAAQTERYKNESIVTVFTGLFQLTPGGVAFATCHEVGHLLGKVADESMKRQNRLSLESEADYWGGKCLQEFISSHPVIPLTAEHVDECHGDISCEKTFKSVRDTLEKIWNKKADHKQAIDDESEGVNQFYSDANCRLLSALMGAINQKRPKCWYNPQYRSPHETNSVSPRPRSNQSPCRISQEFGCRELPGN